MMERGIVIVGCGGVGKIAAMQELAELGVVVVDTPSPFDPEPIPYTNPYKDLPALIYNNRMPSKRNTNRTPPKKRRKK